MNAPVFHPAALAELKAEVIYYERVNDRLWIWAVMHASREPGYWKTRQLP